jgi:hypothetical protein
MTGVPAHAGCTEDEHTTERQSWHHAHRHASGACRGALLPAAMTPHTSRNTTGVLLLWACMTMSAPTHSPLTPYRAHLPPSHATQHNVMAGGDASQLSAHQAVCSYHRCSVHWWGQLMGHAEEPCCLLRRGLMHLAPLQTCCCSDHTLTVCAPTHARLALAPGLMCTPPPCLATHSMSRGCAYKVSKAVMALHSLGSVPLRLLLYRYLQVGRACTSGRALQAQHGTTRGEAQPAQCPPSAERSPELLSALVGPSLHIPLHVGMWAVMCSYDGLLRMMHGVRRNGVQSSTNQFVRESAVRGCLPCTVWSVRDCWSQKVSRHQVTRRFYTCLELCRCYEEMQRIRSLRWYNANYI